jgi:hypothetical protein
MNGGCCWSHAARADQAVDLAAEDVDTASVVTGAHADAHFAVGAAIGHVHAVDVKTAAFDEADEALQRSFGTIDLDQERVGHQ